MLINFILRFQKFRDLGDYPHKLKRKFQFISGNYKNFTDSEIESDSQSTEYVNWVSQIIASPKKYKEFRKSRIYREILEHVTYDQGLVYLEKFHAMGGSTEAILSYKKLDAIGSPRRFFYRGVGFISPTTLRYFATAQEIFNLFDLRDIANIVEIGCGYGGQAAVLKNLGLKNNYIFYDIPEVQSLISKFLSQNNPQNSSNFPSIYSIQPSSGNFVLSNYAFSELPEIVQRDYLSNLISSSKSGYMIMNSGLTDFTGRSSGKMALKEIMSFIPNAYILEEYPKTGPDNYLLVWGTKE